MSLRIENFLVDDLFAIIEQNRKLFQARGITLDVNGSGCIVKADKALTLFMINTLVENAAKFTPEGGRVSLECTERESYVELSVVDTGIGISENDLNRILGTKVYDASQIGEDNELLKPKSKGSGFGLMNCKGIIEKYKKTDKLFSVCSFDITSTKGKGSCFSFRLPKGIMRCILLLLAMLPVQMSANTDIFEQLNEYADSVYMCNVNSNNSDAFIVAQKAIDLLNTHYKNETGGNDTLSLCSGKASELQWWQNSLYKDSLKEEIYYNILDIRNELAIASLALNKWDAYNYNNNIYATLYRLVHEDDAIAERYTEIEEIAGDYEVAIAFACLLILLLLAYYTISFVRHNVIARTNERLVLEMNSRLLNVTAKDGKQTVKELAQEIADELFACLGETMRIKEVALLLDTDDANRNLYVSASAASTYNGIDIYMQRVLENGEPAVFHSGTMRLIPLYTKSDGERLLVGVLGVETERPLSENEVVSIELVSSYLASVAYHSATRVANGYMALEELEDEAQHMHYEENRLHVQNMVMDNCLSVIKHETVYYPSRIKELALHALMSPENNNETVADMHELMGYYSSIFGILSNCAKRELDEMSFSLSSVELSSLFGRMTRFVERRSQKCGVDVKLVCEPVKSVVRADISLVEFLFESLLNAAMAYPVAGVLKLSAMEAGDFVKIELSDTRRELPSEELTDMFTPTRSNLAENGGIVGMEYLIAKEIVRLHEDYTGRQGGRMEARSDVSGTIIMFTLPK